MQYKKWVSKSLSSLAVVCVSFLLTMFTTGATYALNHSGAITSSETWALADSPHIVTANVNVYNGAVLTIEPGCQVKFDAGTIIYFGLSGASTLNAAGTSLNPITFTSNAGTPAAGDWQGIYFGASTSGATIMDYCTVEYGGNGGNDTNIYCQTTSAPIIQNCTIRHSDGYGIYCDNNSAPTLTNNTISNNGSFPISEFCNQLDSNVTGNTGSGNGTNAIEVRGGAMTSSHTWIPQDFYFNITSTINVYNSAIWTISPGSLVKLHGDIILWIGLSGTATLIADGTSGNPITFTSNASSPAAGDWDGIYFGASTTGSTTMHYCTVEYGGDFNISCASASPTIQHCIIRNSGGDLAGVGITTSGSAAQPLISCSTITNNKIGVYATSNANPTIVDCSITANTTSGVSNTTSAITIDAENNWWGSSDGPSGVGPGSGDAVSNYVDYTPFRTAFDSCLETIVLSPASETNLVGSQHTVTATVEDESAEPIEGIVVSFNITSGPHAGGNVTDTTDANGEATFTYTGTLEGTDTIEASFVDFHGRTRTSNAVTKTWEAAATPTPTPSPSPSPEPTPSLSPEPSPTPTVKPTATYVPTPTPEPSPSPTPQPSPTEPPTAIELTEFKARVANGGTVILKWRTATEVDNAGFNIYRAEQRNGSYAQINNTLIPAKGNATSDARYRYEDTPDAGTYYYKLEDVDYNGVSTMHGPVRVRLE